MWLYLCIPLTAHRGAEPREELHNEDSHFVSPCCLPGTGVRPPHALSHLILTATLHGQRHYDSHLINGKPTLNVIEQFSQSPDP